MTKRPIFTLQKSIIIPVAITVIVLIFGLNNFMSQWMYSEEGHNYLFWAYLGCCAVLFILIRIKKLPYLAPLIILMTLIIMYTNQKFEWRQDYISKSKAGQSFQLMPYIDAYPTYEDHLFSIITGKPKYFQFNYDCFEPALTDQQAGPACNSANQIQNTYNIDIRSLIDNYYQKMKYTAQQIETKTFNDISQFETCLRDRQCVMIPLLPPEVDENQAQSREYLSIRKQFWSLIEDDAISSENCEYMDLCRAMRNLGVYTIQKNQEVNPI